MKIIELGQSKGRMIKKRITIHIDNPHTKSRAAYEILKEKLTFNDVDYHDIHEWLEFREIYLLKQKALNGGILKCHYCPKEGLDIGGRSTPQELAKNNKNKNLATIDHVIPLSKGGERYNEKNLVVSCKKCNQKKDNKILKL